MLGASALLGQVKLVLGRRCQHYESKGAVDREAVKEKLDRRRAGDRAGGRFDDKASNAYISEKELTNCSSCADYSPEQFQRDDMQSSIDERDVPHVTSFSGGPTRAA
jgi:hypothetical protein